MAEHEIVAFMLFQLVAADLPSDAKPIVAAALRVGCRRTSVRALAFACGLPLRTLQWRIAHYPGMTARWLLAHCLSLHAAWNQEKLGRNIKRVAASAGFRTRAAYANYLRRNAHVTAAVLSRTGTLDALLDELVRRFRSEDICAIRNTLRQKPDIRIVVIDRAFVDLQKESDGANETVLANAGNGERDRTRDVLFGSNRHSAGAVEDARPLLGGRGSEFELE